MNATQSIMKHEGFRSRMYKDTVGVPTIGYGFNLQEVELPRPVADLWLSILIQDYEKELQQYPWYHNLDPVRQAAILDMYYNLGGERFSGFKRMISALEHRKYDEAADEMLDSKWASQVGERADTLASIMRHGSDYAGKETGNSMGIQNDQTEEYHT